MDEIDPMLSNACRGSEHQSTVLVIVCGASPSWAIGELDEIWSILLTLGWNAVHRPTLMI